MSDYGLLSFQSLFKAYYPESTPAERLANALKHSDSLESRGNVIHAAMARIAELEADLKRKAAMQDTLLLERNVMEATYQKVIDQLTAGCDSDD